MTDKPGGLEILLGKGDGTFQSGVNYSASSQFWPNGAGAGDFNKDGIVDLVLSAAVPDFGSALVLYLGNGDGTFKPAVLIPTDFGAEPAVVADFNGDGNLDLVVPHCCGDSDITYLLGNGDGTFQKEVPISYNGGIVTAALGDFNGDGKPDIAFASGTVNDTSSSLVILMNTPSTAPAPVVNGVISASAFGAFGDIAPGTFIEIYGTNLATGNRTWGGSDFTGSTAPTSLDGTSVQIGGKAAFIYYISAGQVDVLVPGGVPAGVAPLAVTAGGVTSAPYQATVSSTEPGLLAPRPSRFRAISTWWRSCRTALTCCRRAPSRACRRGRPNRARRS